MSKPFIKSKVAQSPKRLWRVGSSLPTLTNLSPNTLLPTTTIVKLAKNSGVDFGNGNHFERIRYFIKIGILPHQVRKSLMVNGSSFKGNSADEQSTIHDAPSSPVGHLPYWCVQTLIKIDRLHRRGLSFPQIAQRLKREELKQQSGAQKREQITPKTSKDVHPIAKEPSRPILLLPKFGLTEREVEKKLEDHQRKIKNLIQEQIGRAWPVDASVRASLATLGETLPRRKLIIIASSTLLIAFVLGLVPMGIFTVNYISQRNQKSKERLNLYEQSTEALGQVLAASSDKHRLYIDADTEVTGITLFAEDITAPNVLYAVAPGTGISVSGGQRPTISLSGSVVNSVNDLSGTLTIKGSGKSSISASGSTITISTDAISSESDTLSTVTGRGASTSTAVTLSGGLTLGGDLDLSDTNANFDLTNTGSLRFRDGTNILASIIDQGAFATLRLSDKGSTGDPSTCTSGDVYFNATDASIKACTATDTWEALDASGATSAWSALTNPSGNLSLSHSTNTTTMTTSATTQTFWTFTGTSFTTGEILDITGTWAPTDGSTNESIDINITHSPTTLADNFQSINLTTTDSTALGNTIYGIQNTITLTGNAAKTGRAYYGTVTSTSTTADTLYGLDLLTDHNAASASGNKTLYGLRSQVTNDGITDSTGTHNLYGGYFSATGNTGGTSTAYGIYATASGADTVYGHYVTGSGSISGNFYGVYIDADNSGAGTNYGLYSLVSTGGIGIYGDLGTDTGTCTGGSEDSANCSAIAAVVAQGHGIGSKAIFAQSADSGPAVVFIQTGSGDILRVCGNSTCGSSTAELKVDEAGLITWQPEGSLTNGQIHITQNVTSANATASGTTRANDINLTNSNTTAGTFYGYDITLTDSTALANTDYGISNTLTLTGNAAKTGRAYYGTVTSTSTTADTLYGLDLLTDHNAASASGNKTLYGLRSQVTNDGITDAAGTHTIYGGYFSATGNTGGTSTAYGIYATATGADTNDLLVLDASGISSGTLRAINIGGIIPGAGTETAIVINGGWDTAISTEAGVSGTAYIEFGSDQDSGTILSIGTATATSLTGTLTAQSIDLSNNYVSTNQSATAIDILLDTASNSSGTIAYKGLEISGGSLTQSTAGSTAFKGIEVTTPAITQNAGTLTADGIEVTTGSVTTAGTQQAIDIVASGVAAGTLNAINISSITAGAGTETGLAIGSGWDRDLSLADSTAVIVLTATDGQLDFTDGTNTLLTVDDVGTTGNLTVTGTVNATFATANSERLCWDAAGASDITDCTGTPGDYAEEYGTTDPSIETSDLVAVDRSRQAEIFIKDNQEGSRAWVVKSRTAYQPDLIGIVSTNPNEVIGRNFQPDENPRPISLNGRVPVKVSTENGPIEAGDYITSSSTPGVGMKATKAGRVIGMALESWHCSTNDESQTTNALDVSPSALDQSCTGKILVFVNPNWYLGSLAANGSLAYTSPSTLDENTPGVNDLYTPGVNLANGILNPDGTLAEKYTDQLLTAEEIQKLVTEEVARQLATIPYRMLDLDDTGSQTQTSGKSDVPPTFDSGVTSEASAVSSAESVAGTNSSDGGTNTEASSSADLAAQTNQTLEELDKLLTTTNLRLDTLTVTGPAHLASTQVAGTFSQDGTLIIDYGRQINVLANTLYLQNDSLAGCPDFSTSVSDPKPGLENIYKPGLCKAGIDVDIGAGKVIIDKQGNLQLAGQLTTDSIKTKELIVDTSDSSAQTIGSASITEGQTQTTILTTALGPNAKIFLTATGPTQGKTLYVAQKSEFESFTVAIENGSVSKQIEFDWLIVNTSQLSSTN